MLAERAFAVCAQAHHTCPLGAPQHAHTKSQCCAGCMAPACQEGIAELPISDPALAVVVVDGAGGRAQVVDSVHVLADRVCRVAQLWCVCRLLCVGCGPRGRWGCLSGRGVCPVAPVAAPLLVILCEGCGVLSYHGTSPCVSVTLASSMFLAAPPGQVGHRSRRSHCAPGP
jgi:hypothetical protein